MYDAVKRKIQNDLIDDRNMTEIHFQVELARSAMSVDAELLRRSPSAQSSLEISPSLFSSRVMKALHVVSSCESASTGVKEARVHKKHQVQTERKHLVRSRPVVSTILMPTYFKRRYCR